MTATQQLHEPREPTPQLLINQSRPKAVYADVLRSLAAFAVIMIHVSGQGVVHTETVSRFSWWVSHTFDSLSRWCVPVFVMVSGALLLGSPGQEGTWGFYRRRLSRVGIPIVFWLVTFLVWRKYYVGEKLTLGDMGVSLLLGTSSFHLYFLFLILGIYLFAPMLKIFVRHAAPADVWTAAAFALVLAASTQTTRLLLHMWAQRTSFEMFVPYIGYFLAGYAIVRLPPAGTWYRFWRIMAYILLPLSLFMIIRQVGRAKTTAEMNTAIEMYYDFSSPGVVVMSLCVFSIVVDWYRHGAHHDSVFVRVCRWIAPATFGIYLIHPMFLFEIFKHHGMPVYPNSLIANPLWALALFTCSLLTTKMIQLVPVVRRIMG